MSVRIRILTTDGIVDLELEEVGPRSTVGSHWNAIQALLAGDIDSLKPFEGVRIKGRLLLTDPDEIERLARLGELDVDDIYEES